MKYALLMLIVVSFNGVAGDVDALDSHLQSKPKALEIAAVDTGVDARWTALPNDKKASNRETREFENRVENIGTGLNMDLDMMISTKLDVVIENLEN